MVGAVGGAVAFLAEPVVEPGGAAEETWRFHLVLARKGGRAPAEVEDAVIGAGMLLLDVVFQAELVFEVVLLALSAGKERRRLS